MARVQASDYGDKQDLILEKASELFASQGFQATSINALAKACDASKAWIYHYYDSKESILLALITDFAKLLREILPEKPDFGQSPEERFRTFLSELMDSAKLESGRYRNVHKILLRDLDALKDEEQAEITSMLDEYIDRVMELVTSIVPELRADHVAVVPITMVIVGATNWLPRWYDPQGQVPPEDLASMMSDMFLNGLRNLESV